MTTEMVLTEFLNATAGEGADLRRAAAEFVAAMRTNLNVEIVPQTSRQFLGAFALYRSRTDKGWGLTDCASFLVMRDRKLRESLAHDQDSSKRASAHCCGRSDAATACKNLSDIKVGKRTPFTLKYFDDFFRLLPTREGSERSWTVTRAQIEAKNYDLKAVNPHRKSTADTRTPEEWISFLEGKGKEVTEALAVLRTSK